MLSSVTLAESFVSSLRVKLFATAARVSLCATYDTCRCSRACVVVEQVAFIQICFCIYIVGVFNVIVLALL